MCESRERAKRRAASQNRDRSACASDIDLLVIALPNNLHLDAALLAAQHKKNVACTKPLARNAQEARKMLEAVQQAGVLHCYGETEVFSPAVMRAKTLIDEGGNWSCAHCVVTGGACRSSCASPN